MKAAGFDAHRICAARGAMTFIVDLLQDHFIDTATHLGKDHGVVEALDWVISSFRLCDALFAPIREAEIATGEGFNFTNKDPEAAEEIKRRIGEVQRMRDEFLAARNAAAH